MDDLYVNLELLFGGNMLAAEERDRALAAPGASEREEPVGMSHAPKYLVAVVSTESASTGGVVNDTRS